MIVILLLHFVMPVRSWVVLDYILTDSFGLKLAFVVTKFPQKVRVKGITNWSLFVYMAARLLRRKVLPGAKLSIILQKVFMKVAI